MPDPQDADHGFYLPGPPGSDHGDFWVGDTVRVHTGSGQFDYNEVDARVMAITITEDDDNGELIVIPELKTILVSIPAIEQYGTDVVQAAGAWFTWPEGNPGPGNLLIGFLAIRDNPGQTVDVVPWSFPDENLLSLAIAGTNWTQIDGFDLNAGGGGIAMAWRISTAADTTFIRWTAASGALGRPRSHQMEIAGLTLGAPSATATAIGSTAGTTYTSPSITVPAAGYVIAGFGYKTSGPADRAGYAGFDVTTQAPAHGLTQGFGNEDFGGYSWFGYLYVAAAGSYTISIDRVGTAYDPTDPYGWIVGFWAGPESAAFPA